MSELRAYQAKAIAGIKAGWIAGARRPLLVAPCGAGKTRMMCAVVEGATRKGRRVLALAHRTELVAQMSAQLTALGLEHGVVQAQRRTNPDARMQVCSVQTLARRGEAPDDISVVLIDEAHHATAGTYRAIVGCYPSLELLLGATATPQRGDGTPLGDVFDHMVVACTPKDLQATGVLVPCDVYAPAAPQAELAATPFEAYQRRLVGKRTLVFCASVVEAESWAAFFSTRGVPAACVEGGTPKGERARILADFAAGKILVVCNVFALTEGTDIPAIEGIIIARGCSVDAALVQMVGRGMRAAPGKKRCIVEDLRGAVHLHGLPDADRVFALEGVASRAADALDSLATCAGCGLVYKTGPACCPRCLHVAPPRPRPRVKRAEMSLIDKLKHAPQSQKRTAFESLVRQARERGYRPGFVFAKFKGMFGHPAPWRLEDVS